MKNLAYRCVKRIEEFVVGLIICAAFVMTGLASISPNPTPAELPVPPLPININQG